MCARTRAERGPDSPTRRSLRYCLAHATSAVVSLTPAGPNPRSLCAREDRCKPEAGDVSVRGAVCALAAGARGFVSSCHAEARWPRSGFALAIAFGL